MCSYSVHLTCRHTLDISSNDTYTFLRGQILHIWTGGCGMPFKKAKSFPSETKYGSSFD